MSVILYMKERNSIAPDYCTILKVLIETILHMLDKHCVMTLQHTVHVIVDPPKDITLKRRICHPVEP